MSSRETLIRLFLGAFIVVALAACTPAKPVFKGSDVTGIDWGGDITLTAHTNQRLSTTELRGKLVVIFFGYTRCPDICAPTLAKLAVLRKALGPEADRIQVIFITVDPTHDTAEQLAGFVPRFDPSFIGLTGTPEEITAVARDYKIAALATDSAGTRFDHSGSVMVKDKAGKLRLIWKNDLSVADMEHDVRLLLKISR